uniref:Uncharacterized protein LOC111111809 isoform X2 n=1 Tax=Crassostrea virginica TaxID=6565 RepID=A0A8B8BP51_CRAVI|nr:uncharacterized protein LOC111111809 isoform X2 [Crassostrea virginica]
MLTKRLLNILTAVGFIFLVLICFMHGQVYPNDCDARKGNGPWHKTTMWTINAMISGIVLLLTYTAFCYSELQNRYQKVTEETDNIKCKIAQLEERHQNEAKQSEILKSKNRRLQESIQERNADNEQLEFEILYLKERLNEDAKKTETFISKNEELQKRLNTEAGDKSRIQLNLLLEPDKLVEEFIELYRNDWTKALEWFRKAQESEHDSIKILLNAMEDIYHACMLRAQTERDTLIRQRKTGQTTRDQHLCAESIVLLLKVTAYQKQNVSAVLPQIIQSVGAKHLDTVNASCWKKYVERCIKICWFMSIQYPPMMLYFGAKEYSNPLAVKYEYTVQPAISLYESGPLLLKGVTSSGSSLIC